MAINQNEITIRIKRKEYNVLQQLKVDNALKTVNDAIKYALVQAELAKSEPVKEYASEIERVQEEQGFKTREEAILYLIKTLTR